MPLRDHFHPPLTKQLPWDGLHGAWPTLIVMQLNRWLPRRYVAAPQVHLGSSFEVDVAALEKDEAGTDWTGGKDNEGVATAVWAPPHPTLAIATDLPNVDEYEVQVYDADSERRLVAAVEIVSPSSKDRPEHRRAFAAKCAALLQDHVCVTIVDVVTTRLANLYRDLLDLLGQTDPALTDDASSLYAVTCRWAEPRAPKNGSWLLETWWHPMTLGQPLPTMPLWLADNLAVPLELEASYAETCRILRIA